MSSSSDASSTVGRPFAWATIEGRIRACSSTPGELREEGGDCRSSSIGSSSKVLTFSSGNALQRNEMTSGPQRWTHPPIVTSVASSQPFAGDHRLFYAYEIVIGGIDFGTKKNTITHSVFPSGF